MSETTEGKPRKLPKPVDFDELYPGRFLKAADLKGQKVTLTIIGVDMEELEGETGVVKMKATLSFARTEKQLVMCKTNGLCLKAMFGRSLASWVGKRVTLFEDSWNGEPCIRIWGSPDITEDMELLVQLPRRRPFKKIMHLVRREPAASTAAVTDRAHANS